MAVMHPVDIENYDYTPTEKEMYYALKEQLPDKYQVFYSVRWFETVDNKRIDSESDFLVFDPSFGFITIEVKGGTGITVEDGTWTLIEDYGPSNSSSRVLKCSPYEQAEKSMRHFRNYFVSEFNQNYNGVYGFAVAFPRYAITDQLAQEAPPETTIDLNDMTSLREKINRIFHYWKNKRNISILIKAEYPSFLSIMQLSRNSKRNACCLQQKAMCLQMMLIGPQYRSCRSCSVMCNWQILWITIMLIGYSRH